MAKLPADLPENWTQGEIISPNGTEVGLSEQHGYNYLMKQVNATQNEVNNVGTTIEGALKDVAKEVSVQEIQDKIGETTDTGGSQNSGTVNAKLNALLEASKVIRHIQRGFVSTSAADDASGTVTLAGFTDLEKMVVILNGDSFIGSGKYSALYLEELTLTSLSTLRNKGGSYSYQVIEFC